MKRLLVLVASVALLLLVLARSFAGDDFKSGVFDPPREAPDFTLQGSKGAPVTLSKLRGKVVLLYFGFTLCPKICPVTVTRLAEVFKGLGPAASDVQVVFVTVDPDRDTPARLREFLEFFNPSFLGATDKEEALDAVKQAYGILATKAASENKKLGYEVHHSSSIYMIDRQGKLRVLVPFGKKSEDILHDVKLLLKK
jgi:protein SCO1/2